MANVGTDNSGVRQAHLRIHVCTVHVYLCTAIMDDAADFYDFRLKNTVGGRISDHQCSQIVFVLFRFGTQVSHINISLLIACTSHGSETGLDGRCGVGTMSRCGNQHFVTMSLSDVLQISADHTETGIFARSTGVRLQTDTCKTCNDSQFFAEIVNQFTVSLCLVFGYKRMHTHKFRTAEGQHFCRSIQLHGAGAKGNHGVGKGDILTVKALDIAHHLRFRMIFIEHFMCQISALAFQRLINSIAYGNIIHFGVVFSCGNGKDGKQHIGSGYVSCFVNTHTYVSIIKVAQIDFLAQCDGTYLLGRYAVGQHKAQGVEVLVIHLFVSQFFDTLFQICGDAVDAFCNGVNTFRTVVHGVKACHGCQQSLCGTDI